MGTNQNPLFFREVFNFPQIPFLNFNLIKIFLAQIVTKIKQRTFYLRKRKQFRFAAFVTCKIVNVLVDQRNSFVFTLIKFLFTKIILLLILIFFQIKFNFIYFHFRVLFLNNVYSIFMN